MLPYSKKVWPPAVAAFIMVHFVEAEALKANDNDETLAMKASIILYPRTWYLLYSVEVAKWLDPAKDLSLGLANLTRFHPEAQDDLIRLKCKLRILI